MSVTVYSGGPNTQIIVNTNKIDTMLFSIKQKAAALLDKVAFDIEGMAKVLAPVDTGALRASIYVSGSSRGNSYRPNKAKAKGLASTKGKEIKFFPIINPEVTWQRIVAVSVNYGIFPEVQGQPYLVPAVDANRDRFLAAWKQLF